MPFLLCIPSWLCWATQQPLPSPLKRGLSQVEASQPRAGAEIWCWSYLCSPNQPTYTSTALKIAFNSCPHVQLFHGIPIPPCIQRGTPGPMHAYSISGIEFCMWWRSHNEGCSSLHSTRPGSKVPPMNWMWLWLKMHFEDEFWHVLARNRTGFARHWFFSCIYHFTDLYPSSQKSCGKASLAASWTFGGDKHI